jgi:hypothetical protein
VGAWFDSRTGCERETGDKHPVDGGVAIHLPGTAIFPVFSVASAKCVLARR